MYIIQYGRNIVITDNMQLMSLSSVVVVQAFISSRLDYCNAILHGLPDRLMRRLQSVQSAAARLITGVPWRYHITLILWQLHWLSWWRRFDVSIVVLVFQCLTGQAPGLSAPHQYQRLPTLISRHSDLCHTLHTAANPSKTVSQSGTVQAFAKDIPIYCMRPQRFMTFA